MRRTFMICSCSEGVMVFRISSRWLASSTEAAMASILSCLSSKRLPYKKDWWLNDFQMEVWQQNTVNILYLVCRKFGGIALKEEDLYEYIYMYLCSFTSVSFFTIALYKAYNQNQTCNTIFCRFKQNYKYQ